MCQISLVTGTEMKGKPFHTEHFQTTKQCNTSHSLDEVTRSFFREALFPSSRQIYNTNKTTLNDRPQTGKHTAVKLTSTSYPAKSDHLPRT